MRPWPVPTAPDAGQTHSPRDSGVPGSALVLVSLMAFLFSVVAIAGGLSGWRRSPVNSCRLISTSRHCGQYRRHAPTTYGPVSMLITKCPRCVYFAITEHKRQRLMLMGTTGGL